MCFVEIKMREKNTLYYYRNNKKRLTNLRIEKKLIKNFMKIFSLFYDFKAKLRSNLALNQITFEKKNI